MLTGDIGGFTARDTNLASTFAWRLREARELGPTTIDIRQTAYSDDSYRVAGREKTPSVDRDYLIDSENNGDFTYSVNTLRWEKC